MLDRSTPPPIHSVLFAFDKPTKSILPNGIPLYIINTEGQDAIRIDFVFRSGQWQQFKKLQALFTCRMLREGCRGYNSSEFAERLDYYGAWLELNVGMNRTFVTLYTLKKFFAPTIELVHRMLTEPIFPEEKLQLIRSNNKAQLLVNLQKGDVRAMRTLRKNIYGSGHPCGMQTMPEDYDTLQRSHLMEFYSQHYSAYNCSIYLSGNVDESTVERIETLFGKPYWGNACSTGPRDFAIVPEGDDCTIIHQENTLQSSIRIGKLMMDVKDEDYLVMRILTTVLGGYFGSRLMKNIREKKGYTYHIGADLITNTSQVMFLVYSEALIDKHEEILNEVRCEMRRLTEEPVPEEEIDMVRNYMLGEICRNYEGPFSLTDAYIFIDHLGLPDNHIEQTIKAIQETSVSRLQQTACRYLGTESLKTVIVTR